MLTLKNITKDYPIGDSVVHALKGIDLSFRESEFVAILGPSGCGKTTLLNIIGGLDHYTSGDLVINGRSTKLYKDKDWDSYRNHSIGFVFQSYNLISHQTVLRNVELALTISGVSKSERRSRAVKALEDVGLGDQFEKKPNQLSGGQMQRVAIARALVNNPDIVLADEPTGALDTETSVQIMDLLKEVAKDKLVIMVTHNPDLAATYATRTICLLDGLITSDSKPLTEEELDSKVDRKPKGTSMSFLTALSLSLTNLMTKKTRTILTAFAGSIGIIGIALILSLSNGVNNYITRIQEDTLSSYPLTIQKMTADSSSIISAVLGITNDEIERHEDGRIYSNSMLTEIVNTMMSEVKTNDLKKFKNYLDNNAEMKDLVTDIRYSYGIVPQIYQYDLSKNGVYQLNPSNILNTFWASIGISESSISEMSSMMSIGGSTRSMSVWSEIIDNQALLNEQYDLLAGRWPSAYNEVILVVDKNNEMSDYTLYSLALKDPNEMTAAFHALMRQEQVTSEKVSFSYQDLLSLQFRLVIPADYYSYDNATGTWVDRSTDADYMAALLTDNSRAVTLSVVGIVRPGEEAMATSVNGAMGYTHELVEYIVAETAKRDIVKQQLRDKELDVFTGHPFEVPKAYSADELRAMLLTQLSKMNEEEIARISGMLISFFQSDTSGNYDEIMRKIENGETVTPEEMLNLLPDEVLMTSLKQYANSGQSVSTYELNMAKLGSYDIEDPTSISIFPKDFKSKDRIVKIIAEYNSAEDRTDDERIDYTDYVALLMSSITRIINSITYILIAFVAISLVVSSIMIGIITYISVLERTKEIGILRAIGASKRDIARVFNAETLIIGFVAGTLGIALTLLLNIPINMIIFKIAEVHNLSKLPWAGGVILIIISMVLTLIAGIIPSRIAARKDPVTALRTE